MFCMKSKLINIFLCSAMHNICLPVYVATLNRIKNKIVSGKKDITVKSVNISLLKTSFQHLLSVCFQINMLNGFKNITMQ